MGWANCGKDSRGRHIGYAWPAECDHPGCKKRIDRGISYACGGMHGRDALGGYPDNYEFGEWCCEGYFCDEHRRTVIFEHEDESEVGSPFLCLGCAKKFEEAYRSNEHNEMWVTDADLYEVYK